MAFYNCTGLTNIIIPASVIKIGSVAFYGCDNITIHGYKNSYAETYANENGITFAEINTDTTNDYEWLEDENGDIAIIEYTGNGGDIIIPSKIDGKSVTSIGRWAFEDCAGLISITIPDSVTSIGHWTFENCRKLTAINVDKNNKNYTSEDGVLFDKDKTTLMIYPAGKKGAYVIPDNVTEIGYSAFSHCTKLTSVTISDSITSIRSWTFYDCTELTNVTIPTSVIEMENEVFYKCDNVVIYGYKNSYAETYANENGLTFAEINIKPTDY